MINLLPPEEKKELSLERKKRVVLANWILILLFFILFSSTMFLIKCYLQAYTTNLKTRLANNEQILDANKENLNKINSFAPFFEKINTFFRYRINIYSILEKISLVLPKNIYLTDFSVSPDVVIEKEGDEINQLVGLKVSLIGFSPTREEVLQLKENMEKEKSFTEISFPLTNWVKSTNITFSVSFKIAKP